ncbi:DUF262 domain-containing protein [Pedobacter sp. MR22-3]|uniref:DUF262 domain-containing protein n=1 Tax=Pedobacter sp. MR22-3 TaxID=2994552 RepID=UPI0022480739|nr:DUF262 domain-containing protein [Pedobacter sp. MR22-3]MCX2584133.1 DUF262 domain-containing protein [Pedobacter sp. MR22-3]
MALSLNAEQKELSKIFKIEEQYIIPSYQRPYSWEYDQAFQLYNDLLSAFNSKQDYFIGNIIIAKADNNRDTLEVVDGQQRLITLLLLFKVLYLFQPELQILGELLEKKDWEGITTVPRIKSNVFEANDEEAITNVLSYDLDGLRNRFSSVVDKNQKVIERYCSSRFEATTLYFFNWIQYYVENHSDIKDFTFYLLKQVYLLPIELSGPTQDEANEKALVIFETINNRGMNLEDADIFKAKLYNKAKNIKEEGIFIEQWTDFKSNASSLNLDIDDIFRFYSHIIRGKEGITSSETNLREFFINEKFSPFELKKYREVLNDLFRIIEILEALNQERVKETNLAKWIQIIDAYTNQYPKYAIVNYLFVNNLKLDQEFEEFLKSIIRFTYYQGSTSTVKFEIYNIIKQTSLNIDINTYHKSDVSRKDFNYLGRLKKGFALLAYYLKSGSALSSYNIDKIISLKDKKHLVSDWQDIDLNNIIDSLGNFVILDIPKRNIPLNKKAEYFQISRIEEVRELFSNSNFSYSDFEERDKELKDRIVNFFKG